MIPCGYNARTLILVLFNAVECKLVCSLDVIGSNRFLDGFLPELPNLQILYHHLMCYFRSLPPFK